tara:strand:+ start:17904 stop:18077 length:174 start_codon:yes stop_codon:yes gene_type:complete
LKLYRLTDAKEELEAKDLEGIISILRWANKAFRDGKEKSKERDIWIDKLKSLKELKN